ncbi:MAG: hypothetical protein Kow0090_20000 [Myxococcota bacterium]
MAEESKKERRSVKIEVLLLGFTAALVIAAIATVYLHEPKQAGREFAKMALERAQGGLLEEAAALLERAVQKEPSNHLYHYNLGQTYLGLNRVPEAQTALYNALSLEPNDPQYCVEYARVLAIQKYIPESLTALKRGVLLGFCDMQRIIDDPDYDPVKLDPGWEEIHKLFVERCKDDLKQ